MSNNETPRARIDRAVGSVLFNTSNYPEVVQPHILGRDTSGLRARITEAVVPVIAEEFRTYAAERYEAALQFPDLDWLKQPGAMARHYKKVADDLRAQADRIEAAAEVSADE